MADVDDPFAAQVARLSSPSAAGAPGSDTTDPFADQVARLQRGEAAPDLTPPPETSTLGAFASHAAGSIVPAAGVLAGAELGAEGGAAIGSFAGPVGTVAGGIVGGLGGAFAGGWAGGKAQDTALEALPHNWKDPLTEELQQSEKEHPYASMLGGLVPYAVTMTPFAAPRGAVESATALGRLLSNPVTARVFGGALQGGLELGQEYQNGETPDWAKVAIATGFGVIWNRPNPIGERIAGAVHVPAFDTLRARGQDFYRGPTDYPRAPTIANVDAANVAGAGVTEDVANGSLKRNEAAAQTANEAQRTEASIIGPKPEADLHAAVERMAPDVVGRRNELEHQLKTLHDAEAPNQNHIAQTQTNLRDAREEVGANYARAAESKGVEALEAPTAQLGAASAAERQAISDDVARQLTAAGRPADEAQAHGQLIAERYAARAATLGVPVDELYRAEGARITGPEPGRPETPPTGAYPPIIDDRERQRLENIKKLEALGPQTIETPPTEANPEGGVTLAPGALIGAPLEGEILGPATNQHGDTEVMKGLALPSIGGGSVPIPTEPWSAEIAIDDALNAGWITQEQADGARRTVNERWDSVHATDAGVISEPATSVERYPLEITQSETPEIEKNIPANIPTDPLRTFIDAAKAILDGDGFNTILDARRLAREHGLNVVDNKQVDELVERAVVERAREIVDEGASAQDTFAKMRRLYDNQPNLASRTSASIAEQAYSTPAPLAYVASRLAGIDHDTYVLEPTAGNGMLLMEASPRRAVVNELNPARARSLADQGFAPSRVDAAHPDAFDAQAGEMDVVIANPPFGAVREEGRSKVFSAEGYNTTAIDHAISLNALRAMKADGRAVLIIGGIKAESEAERAAGYQGKAKRRFFHHLLKNYKVSDIFTVSGDLYAKQGAGWPVDVITIEGRGASDRDPLTKSPPPLLKTWDEVGDKLNGIPTRSSGSPEGAGGQQEAGPVSRPTAGAGPEPGLRPEDRGPGGEVPNGQQESASAHGVGGAADVGSGHPELGPVAQDARPVDGTSSSPEPGPDGPEHAVSAGEGRAPGQGGELREPYQDAVPQRGRALEGEVTDGQTPYEPASQAGVKLDTLVPANLRNATFDSLDRLEREHGDVDSYVAKSLGRSVDELGRYFSAEQIDALGLGISNIEKGEGFIIGDQTGIGKGRVVAGMISYARQHGMVPVFVTEKPDLYGDMWRDLHDIGWHEQLGRPINMVMTNSSTRVPLDDAALEWIAERDEARENGMKPPPQRGAFSASQTPNTASHNLHQIVAGNMTPDVVFTTYDQMNSVKGGETDRRNFLRGIAPKAFLIMDEAHNAGGAAPPEDRFKDDTKAPPRSQVFREAVAQAKSVMYSSATYAKNPNVMTLYSKTDMAKAVENPSMLPELIARGGVPLQQAVASMLSQAGQYIRREKSFEGIAYDQENIPVSDKAYSEFTTGLRAVFRFDRAFADEREKLGDAQAAEHGSGMARDSGVGEAGSSSTSFSSIMHNIVSQMIMALKAEKAGERAVAALKAGEKPIIGLSKTNASFIDDFLKDQGIETGQTANVNFSNILHRYLERTRRVTLKTGGDEKVHHLIPLEAMSGHMQAAYHAAEAALEHMDVGDLPISPIDAMRSVIQKAGYTVREVTGRDTMLDYSGSNGGFNNPTVVKRPAGEMGAAGKKMTVKAFNEGKLDAVVLNRSGSTGISMHSSSKFKDQRLRRMIIAEADPNIDTHMQMLGRVNRTGQVNKPSYTHLTADIPAETRPTAILMRKMASLNANTTGAAKSRFSSEGTDFLNKYGDRVVKAMLEEDPMLALHLGIDALPEDPAGLAAKATGRLTLLDPPDQEAFLTKISDLYKQQIEALDASGTNDLEAKSMDLRAQVLESQILKPRTGPSPFQGEVRLDRVSVKSEGRAMEPAEAAGMIEDAKKVDHTAKVQQAELGGRTHLESQIATLKEPEAKENARVKFNENLQKFKALTRIAEPGELVRLTVNGEEMPALVVGLHKDSKAKNPLALSSWSAIFALPSGQRSLGVSLSRLGEGEDNIGIRPDYDMTRGDFDKMLLDARKEGRENRFMISGNLLAGYDQVGGRGQIITHTMEDGSTRPAVLMNRQFNAKDFMSSRSIRFQNGDHVMRYLNAVPDGEVTSTDGVITARKQYRGVEFEMPSARGKGGKYFTDSTVRSIYDGWEKKGSVMRATVSDDTAARLIDAFRKIDAVFETNENQETAATLGNMHPAAEAALELAQGPEDATLEQGRKSLQGRFKLKNGDVRATIELTKNADASTFIEESGHDFLHQMSRDVLHDAAPGQLKADWNTVLSWLNVSRDELFETGSRANYTQKARAAHEKFAAGFQQYLFEGRAPSARLAGVFERFKTWLTGIYKTIQGIPYLKEGINDDVRGVFDRLLAAPEPKGAIITPEQPARPTFSDIHAVDAREAQGGAQADAIGDRITSEAEQREKEHVPAQQAIEAVQRTEAANNAGEASKRPDEAGFLEEGGGRSEPDTGVSSGGDGSGQELGLGGAGVSQGDAAPAGAGSGPVPRQPARPGAVPNPEPPDTFGPDTRDVDRAGNINLDRISAPDDVKRVIRAAAEANDNFIGDRRGVVSWAETEQLAEALGMSNDRLLQRQIGQAFNASEAYAARQLLVQSAHTTHAAMRAAADGGDQDVLAYVEARERHKLIQAQVAGLTAEAGRTLNIFKKSSGEGMEMAGAVDKIIRDGSGITLDQARREAKLGSALNTPEQVSQFMNATRKPTFGDMLLEYWINNLISGPVTHFTYSIANQILSLVRAVPETGIAAAIGGARRAMGRTGERVMPGEVGKRLETQFGRGAVAGAQAAKESFLAGNTLRLPGEKGAVGNPLAGGAGAPLAAGAPTLEAGTFGVVRGLKEGFVTGAAVLQAAGEEGAPRWGMAYSRQGALPDIKTPIGNVPLGTIQRMPSRAIAGIHSYFRVSNYLMEINALAYRQAMEEREAQGGVSDTQFAARIEELKRNPPDEMMKAARDTATNATLMGAPGAVTQKLARLVNTPIDLPGVGPVKLFRFIDPFVSISSNIMKEGLLSRTPIGLLSQSIRDDLSGKHGNVAADMAAARMIAGTALAVTTVYLAHQGMVNGSGPADHKLFNVWTQAGNLPHSVRIGDMWYAVNRLGPLGLLMGVSADLHDVAAAATDGEYLQAGNLLQHAFTHNILDESFLRGPADLLGAIENPATNGERWIKNMGTSFLPFSVGMAQMARAADPYSREARTFMDSVKAKTPGLSESLWPRVSIWGQPMPSYDAAIHSGVTAIYKTQVNPDPVDAALLKLGIGVAPVKQTIRGVRLNDQQLNDYATLAGRMTKQRLDAIVGSQIFRTSPGHVQHDLIMSTVKQSRTAAEGWMFSRYPAILQAAHQQKLDILHKEDEN